MAVLYPAEITDLTRGVINAFTEPDHLIRKAKREVWIEKLPFSGFWTRILNVAARIVAPLHHFFASFSARKECLTNSTTIR
jgi:hypothetical protein